LPHLAGHGGARPVRIGNAAAGQVQLDTYGELIEAAVYVVRSGRTIDRATANMLSGFGHEVAISFDEPDEGIWEIRDVPRRISQMPSAGSSKEMATSTSPTRASGRSGTFPAGSRTRA